MMPRAIRVLVAEDEQPLGVLLRDFLTGRGCEVSLSVTGDSALMALQEQAFDVAVLDVMMPGVDGIEILRRLREEQDPPEVIIVTGNGAAEPALSAMRHGAYDYLTKPYRMADIELLVRRAFDKRELARENTLLHNRLAQLDPLPDIITQDPALQELLALTAKVAKSDSPVLVIGESGTGKELIARALHRLSGRSAGRLVDLNCEALASATIETELFGYEKGAFAGAESRKTGLIELAADGTLFLDEICGLESRLQGTLLRVLEQGAFFRVGGTQQVASHARIVAATNRDIASAVNDGAFRKDLYYRINTITIALPALRDRPADIPLLANYFLKQSSPVGKAPRLSEGARDSLLRYRWPGNIRELRNVIERAALLATNGVVDVADLPLGTAGVRGATPAELLTLQELEKRHIERVLSNVQWHQGRAASILGISSKTLYRKIREYGFNRPRAAASAPTAGASEPPTGTQ
ncbi:MAG: sigma-54-dependent transcriptional regulator [Gemmatimonadaceae bacterium]